MQSRRSVVGEIVFQDRHLELERTVVVLVVDEQDADEFLADVDLGGIILLRARHHANFRIAEQTLQICVEFPDFLNVHKRLQCSNKASLLSRARPPAVTPCLYDFAPLTNGATSKPGGVQHLIHRPRRLGATGLPDNGGGNACHRDIVRHGLHHHRAGADAGTIGMRHHAANAAVMNQVDLRKSKCSSSDQAGQVIALPSARILLTDERGGSMSCLPNLRVAVEVPATGAAPSFGVAFSLRYRRATRRLPMHLFHV